MISFQEINMLHESIRPLETNYGTNDICDDKNIKITPLGNTKVHVTYFYHDDVKCKVLYYDDGTIAYGVTSKSDNKKWILHPSKKDGSMKSLFTLYGKVVFIIKEFIDKFDIKYLTFTGSEDRLNTTYSSIFNKTAFKNMMKNIGFDISQKENEHGEIIFSATKEN